MKPAVRNVKTYTMAPLETQQSYPSVQTAALLRCGRLCSSVIQSFVIDARAKAEGRIIQWAKGWELACTFETVNDMFFTEDFSVKASFQRLHQAKKELRLQPPAENESISVFSSNFHAVSFRKAFNITLNGRHATTDCIAWRYERFVYAALSQHGFDV